MSVFGYSRDGSSSSANFNENIALKWVRGHDGGKSSSMIPGLGKDAPKVVNDQGGSQSHLPYRFDLIDPQAIFALAEVLYQGSERHGEDNWRKIPINDHLNHALAHIYAYMAGDEQDDHLGHAFCRMMFAVALERGNK